MIKTSVSRFSGTKCQFGVSTEGFNLFVYGLDFGEREFKRGKDAQLVVSKAKPDFQRQKIERVKAARPDARFLVFRTMGLSILPVPFVVSFCRKHQTLFEQMNFSGPETIRLGANFASFFCPHLDISLARPRLENFARLIKGTLRPILPILPKVLTQP